MPACRAPQDKINTIEWSCDSLYYACGMYKRGLVQLFSLEQADWEAKIDEGSAGLTHVRWSPDGRHVLTTADFQLRITVWSLVSQQVNYLKFPKFAGAGYAPRDVQFHPHGGQSDFVWLSARTPHGGASYVWGEPDEIKKNTHPKNIPALFRAAGARSATTVSNRCAAAPKCTRQALI